MRKLLNDALRTCNVEVVGEAGNGTEALEACARLHPDVMTLDLQMPGLSGMDVLRRLPPGGPGVIVVSAYTDEGSALAVEALSIGAAEVIRKPAIDGSMSQFAADLSAGVQAAAAARHRPGRPAVTRPHTAPATPAAKPRSGADRATAAPPRPRSASRVLSRPVVVIASSTGGPKALAEVVPRLPNPCGAGVLIVQHMPPGFTRSLAERLNAMSKLEVREAVSGDRLQPGVALLAPGGLHLRLYGGTVKLTEEPPIGGLRPRADVTIEDVAREWHDRCVLMVLTGMGHDATKGAHALKAAGGVILTESEETCVVYGMPRSINEAGLSDVVEPLTKLPAALKQVMR
jgi:two-component system, chemotaxis family, protein-glutamate methylesterase/glutaminase